VRYRPAPDARGTVVTLSLECHPLTYLRWVPGAGVAQRFGAVPEQLVAEALRRFKELMEAGEIPTTEGQPHG
jgi:uncharacterized membrane protein